MQRFHETLICPVCKRATVPMLLRIEDAQETARPRIPSRFVLQCSRPGKGKDEKCGAVWYLNAENTDRKVDNSAA